MKRSIVFYSAVISILAAGLSVIFAPSTRVNAQQRETPLVKLSGSSSPAKDARGDAAVKRFSAAAVENVRSRDALRWDFGGKAQNGWAIYVPLISQTIGTEKESSSPEFAAAVAQWQKNAGIEADGIIDRPTLEALIKFWQSRRVLNGSYPSDDQLISAPISEFFDPTRDPSLLQLERETYSAYKRMLRAAAKDLGSVKFTKNGEIAPGEKFFTIVSAFRSREYQDSLRRKEPNAGRGALAKVSVHSTGRAIDIYVGGEPVTTKDPNRMIQVQTPAYKWLVKNASKFGFVPYFYEPWHWEYVGGAAK
jgi:peptidoglycan hydrolase-like protein with peptidoglycan-binding domain